MQRLKGVRSLVDAAGSRRRLQALSLKGWTFDEIGLRLGTKRASPSFIASGKRVEVFVAKHNDIVRVTRELMNIKGPSKDTTQRAESKGWLPLHVWEDIDNPDDKPRWWEARTEEGKVICPVCFQQRYPKDIIGHVWRYHRTDYDLTWVREAIAANNNKDDEDNVA